MLYLTHNKPHRTPWNKGKLTGQKPPLKLNEVWAIRIRIRLQISKKTRDLALFNLALDSKLRSCNLVKLKVSDVAHGTRIAKRSTVMQMKTKRPVQFVAPNRRVIHFKN
jgi:hypothetical protein